MHVNGFFRCLCVRDTYLVGGCVLYLLCRVVCIFSSFYFIFTFHVSQTHFIFSSFILPVLVFFCSYFFFPLLSIFLSIQFSRNQVHTWHLTHNDTELYLCVYIFFLAHLFCFFPILLRFYYRFFFFFFYFNRKLSIFSLLCVRGLCIHSRLNRCNFFLLLCMVCMFCTKCWDRCNLDFGLTKCFCSFNVIQWESTMKTITTSGKKRNSTHTQTALCFY